MNNAFTQDVLKQLKKEVGGNPKIGSPRRYEPESGLRKHNERIHRESAQADRSGKLPFSFRKPYKPLGSSELLKCVNCGHVTIGTKRTVGIICSNCRKYSRVVKADEGDLNK